MSDLLSYVINMPDFEKLFEKLSGQNSNNISGLQKLEGKRLPVPAVVGEYEIKWTFDEDIYITNIKYSQSGWRYEDYWDLKIGDTLTFKNKYTGEIADDEVFYCNCYVPANTEITLILHNVSGNSRDVWASLHYISKKLIQEPPVEPTEPIEPVDPNNPDGVGDIEHNYDYLIVMRWENNTLVDMDLHAFFEPIHQEIYWNNRDFILDDNNRAWLDRDFVGHLEDETKEVARTKCPEIITILGKPSNSVKIFVRDYHKFDGKLDIGNLKEDVTIEIFKKETNGNQVLLNKFSVAGNKFTSDNYDIDFCTIDLDTGTITKCEGVENAI